MKSWWWYGTPGSKWSPEEKGVCRRISFLSFFPLVGMMFLGAWLLGAFEVQRYTSSTLSALRIICGTIAFCLGTLLSSYVARKLAELL
jgi:hypothetical protein